MRFVENHYPLKEKEKEIAIMNLTAFVMIGIFEIRYDVDDWVKVAGVHGIERTAFRWCKLKADVHDAKYFTFLGERYYLHDMLWFNH